MFNFKGRTVKKPPCIKRHLQFKEAYVIDGDPKFWVLLLYLRELSKICKTSPYWNQSRAKGKTSTTALQTHVHQEQVFTNLYLEVTQPLAIFPWSHNICLSVKRAPVATKPLCSHIISPKVKQPIHPSSRNWPIKWWLCFLVKLKLELLITRSRSSFKSDILNLKIHILCFPHVKEAENREGGRGGIQWDYCYRFYILLYTF